MADGRHFAKTVKTESATVRPILMKLSTMTHIGP